QLFLGGALDVEGLAAAAGILDVRIVELESLVQSFACEVEFRSVEELQALWVDEHFYPMTFEREVLGPDIIGVFDLVGEARAAGRAHTKAQPDALAPLVEAARDVLRRGCGQ